MAGESAWICGIGMVTPVGDSAAQTVTSVRAGISGYAVSPVHNKGFLPMTLSLVPEDVLPPLRDELLDHPRLSSRQVRMLRLAHPALLEAVAALPEHHLQRNLPLFLAGPETFPSRPLAITETFLNLLAAQTQVAVDRPGSKLFTTGRSAGMQALRAALDSLATGKSHFVLVGGVDSYLDLYLLGMLDADDRVLADGIMDGFAPAEGAGFLLLCSDTARDAMGTQPPIKLHSPGFSEEPGHRYSDTPHLGEGLSRAVSIALEGVGDTVVRTVFSGMNGESFWAKEWGVAYSRNASAIDPDFRFEHPADCYGDLGAATAPVLIGLAASGMLQGHTAGPCLSCVSAELGERAATVITAQH